MDVAIITPVLAHYRRNLFTELDRTENVRFEHYSTTSSRAHIAAMNPRELRRFTELTNVPIGRFLWQRGVLRVAFSRRIDSLVFTGDVQYLSTWVAAIVARCVGKKVYFWTIGWHRSESGFRRLARLAFYRIGHRMMIYGDAEKRRAVEHGFPPHRIDVVYNSVMDPSDVDVSAWSSSQKELSVGAVVRLNRWKRLDLLIEAVAELRSAGTPFKIVLGGDGPELGSLRSLAAAREVPIEFLGAIHSPAEIAQFYRRVMISVIPSAAGLSAMQSLAHGVPLITDDDESSQMPEANSVVEGVTGSRFRSGDVASLASRIREWHRRLSIDSASTVAACREEIESKWSPTVQSRLIVESLLK